MRLLPIDGLIKHLKGEIPSYLRQRFTTKEAAYERLKQLTGQDFGMDADKREAWYKTNKWTWYKARLAQFRNSNGGPTS